MLLESCASMMVTFKHQSCSLDAQHEFCEGPQANSNNHDECHNHPATYIKFHFNMSAISYFIGLHVICVSLMLVRLMASYLSHAYFSC